MWLRVVVSVGEGNEWKLEAKLGQSVSVNVDAVSVGLSDSFSDAAVSLNIKAAAGLISADHCTSSIHSCRRLKVSGRHAALLIHAAVTI